MLIDYLIKFHIQDCLNILSEQDILGYFSVKIDFINLFETYPDIGDQILCSPVETLLTCDNDLVKAQQTILENNEFQSQLAKLEYYSLKRNVHTRFFGLPFCPELHRTIFPKNVDLGCFLKVTGTVVRVTQSKMLEYQRKYVCVKCKYENLVEAKFEQRYVLKTPLKCQNDEKRCKSTNFTQVNMVSREHCKDYQEIKIQEQVNKLSIGTIPGSIWVILEDDLVDICKPGDDVQICATVRRRWHPSTLNKKCEVELVLQANFLEVCNAQRSEVVSSAPDIKDCFDEYWAKYEQCPVKGRDHILNTVCPQVYGLHLVKLAVLLTVITGSNHVTEKEGKKENREEEMGVRGQCHLLLVGDPGTGKSELLSSASGLSSRGVMTAGAGASRAGLTCAALREDGEWQLEAGALVLSDGGVCAIDEIGQLRDHDRTSIHEAMEQQTISIAKAGIVCKLNTRCAIIAACNPKGNYDTDQPLSANVSLGTPLLSRFDLIFILLDCKNKKWDQLVSSYILFGSSKGDECKKQWTLEKLQTYIALVGPRQTKMTKSANTILQTYYMTQRMSHYRDPSRTTVRMLDSLVRLSQAHCRLMYRTTILPMDAVTAVALVDLSMQDCTLDDTVDALHSTLPKHSDFEYLSTAKKLLTKLNLYEIWKEELLYYAKLLQVDHKTLENDINEEKYDVFAKFDDLIDENVTIPPSLITSSYFNGKKKENKTNNVNENNKKVYDSKEMSEKLAATLKKQAAMNKEDKNPPKEQKTNKRKRKEVTIDTTLLKNNKTKKAKEKSNRSNTIEDEINNEDLLKAVPSVNDVFRELDIDFNFSNNSNEGFDETVVQDHMKSCSNENKTKTNNANESRNQEIKAKEILKESNESKTVASTASKLNKFKFVDKHDLSKLYEEKIVKNTDVQQVKVEKISPIKCDENVVAVVKKVSSSQISMFESSDCDIDLDL